MKISSPLKGGIYDFNVGYTGVSRNRGLLQGREIKTPKVKY
jgi:hypothetical protein